MADDRDYFESSEFQEILHLYEDSAESGHPVYVDADDLADIADYYYHCGRYQDADNAINQALRQNPEAVSPLLYKAREALNLGDYDLARAYAGRVRAVDELEAFYLDGEILVCEGKPEEADPLFRQRLRELPPDEQPDFIYNVASLYSEYGMYERAMAWISRSKGDDSEDLKELMARALYGMGKYEDCSRLYNELIDQHPYSKYYWNALASTQYMNEDYSSAVTSSEYAIAIDPEDPESNLAKAYSLYRLGNYEEALTYFERYSEKVDDDDFGFLHQGSCLLSLGRFDEAINKLETAERVADADSPCLPEIYQELAFAFNEKKMPETALYYLDKTKELDCDHLSMEIIRGYILLADNRVDEARNIFTDVVLKSPSSRMNKLRIILAFYDNHYVKAAYTLFQQFFSRAKDNWCQGYSYMALCCLDLKKYDEFLDYLGIALEKNPKEAKTALAHLFPSHLKPEEYIPYIKERLNLQ